MRGSCWLPIVLVLACAGRAVAFNFFELEAYPATTEGQGLHEFESQTSVVADGTRDDPARHRLLRSSLEYNYGLTERIDGAVYVDFERPNGDALDYAGARFRLRGGLWEQGRFPVDLGWYVEAEVPRHGPTDLELEFRPLASFEWGRLSVDVNPQFDLPTAGAERRTLEFAYSARAYWRASRVLVPGVEVFGALGQIRDIDSAQRQEHYVFPMLYARVLPGLQVKFGPGFGLTRGSDTLLFKLGVEYEFTQWFGSDGAR